MEAEPPKQEDYLLTLPNEVIFWILKYLDFWSMTTFQVATWTLDEHCDTFKAKFTKKFLTKDEKLQLATAIDDGEIERVSSIVGPYFCALDFPLVPLGYRDCNVLTRAARLGRTEIVRLLVKHRATITMPVLEAANNFDTMDVLVFLLGKYAAKNAHFGWSTLLMSAVRRKWPYEVMQLLLTSKVALAGLNHQNHLGRTPLFYSLLTPFGVSQLLLEAGADANAQDQSGKTPLHTVIWEISEMYERVALIKLLLDFGANINGVDSLGDTPLHAEVERSDRQSLPVVNLLVRNGADLSVRNRKDQTAMDIAKRKLGDVHEIVKAMQSAQ